MDKSQSLVTFPPKDIVTKCKNFITYLVAECEILHHETKAALRGAEASGGKAVKGEPFPLGFKGRLSDGKKANFRSPKEQADSLLKRSPSCFSAHMTNKARHVNVAVGAGSFSAGLKGLNLSKDHQAMFKVAWVKAMKQARLHNNKGVCAWGEGDEFHLQLPGAYKRTSVTKKLENQCMDEYLKLTREGGKAKNTTFEGKKFNKKKLERAAKRTGIALDAEADD